MTVAEMIRELQAIPNQQAPVRLILRRVWVARDARGWLGGAPLVAHPPCRLWAKLRQFAKAANPVAERMLAVQAVQAELADGDPCRARAHTAAARGLACRDSTAVHAMTALARTFVIRTADNAAALHNFLKQNAAAMADQGQPLEVRVSVWKPRASDAQRALIWVINEQIAQGAWVRGQQFDAECWHEHAKRELLPDETAKGVKKWRVLANGDRVLNMSTEHLDRGEKTLYIEALLAFAASVGVVVDVKSPEYLTA